MPDLPLGNISYGIKKNEMMLFAAARMDLETVTPSEVSQKKTNIIYCLHVESKKNGINELIYKTETDSQVLKANMIIGGKGEGEINWEIWIDIYIYLNLYLSYKISIYI